MSDRRFDLLVFDWDGTLVDSAGHIAASIRAACEDLELTVPTVEAARHVIGLGMHDALGYLLPDLDRGRYRDVANRYRHHFLAGDSAIEAFPMVEQGLADLEREGFLLAVATGKSRVDSTAHWVVSRSEHASWPLAVVMKDFPSRIRTC